MKPKTYLVHVNSRIYLVLIEEDIDPSDMLDCYVFLGDELPSNPGYVPVTIDFDLDFPIQNFKVTKSNFIRRITQRLSLPNVNKYVKLDNELYWPHGYRPRKK